MKKMCTTTHHAPPYPAQITPYCKFTTPSACWKAVVVNHNHQGLRRVSLHHRPLRCKAIEEAAPLSGANLSQARGVQVVQGTPSPMGPSPLPGGGGVNFALASPAAAWVTLCLFDDRGNPVQEVKCYGVAMVLFSGGKATENMYCEYHALDHTHRSRSKTSLTRVYGMWVCKASPHVVCCTATRWVAKVGGRPVTDGMATGCCWIPTHH